MSKVILLVIFLAGSMTAIPASAQQTTQAAVFRGAEAKKDAYRAVYQLNDGSDKKIRAELRNMQNALNDPRLKGKLTIELVAHSGGIAVFLKSGPYDSLLRKLKAQGVIFAACENTMREKNISKSEILPYISFVPSGNGELIIRQQQGWAIIHP